tara:strand:+ start:125 stop:343 length:219 start_codon:yes stop_codon:yes gene_type:complete
MKTFEIEIASTTYRTYYIDSESKDDAVSRAFDEMEVDWEISKAWKQNAEVSFVEEQEKPKDDSELDKLNQDL